MKILKNICYVLFGIFYGVVLVLAFFAGMGRISREIVQVLLLVLLLLFAIGILCFGGIEVIKYYIKSMRNIKSCGDPLFDDLDDFKLHCGESKEHYQDMINAIDFFYAEGGKVDNSIGNDLKRLYSRLEFLKKGIAVNDHIITCITSLGLSISATMIFEAAFGTIENDVLYILTLLLGLLLFSFVFLYPYSNSCKGGERQVHMHEIEQLQRKISKAEKENIIENRDEDVMFSRRNILNALNEMYMRVLKKRREEIFGDIKIIEKLNLYVENISECRKECFVIGKTKRRGVLIFDKNDNLVSSDYYILYNILRKYKLIYEIECIENHQDCEEK